MKKNSLSLFFWSSLSLLVIGILIAPHLSILLKIIGPIGENWSHLIDTVFFDYISNTLILCVGVSFFVLILGGCTAWFITMYDFPGRQLLEWLLLLPLAIPAYILAYIYTDFFDAIGPFYNFLLNLGVDQTTLNSFDIRTIPGCIFIFSFAFYPYVYLLARISYIQQSTCLLEVSQTLGYGPVKRFLKVALPLSRPALISGIILALMEVLNDFGTVQYFGIDTFTTGIYRTWLGFNDPITANQLASILLLFVFTLLIVEKYSRQKAHYYSTTNHQRQIVRKTLQSKQKIMVSLFCFIPPTIGFIFPFILLSKIAIGEYSVIDVKYIDLIQNTLILALLAACAAIILCLCVSYALRFNSTIFSKAAYRIACVGYAIPGSILAVGIMGVLSQSDHFLNKISLNYFDISLGLIFSGTIIALLYAYVVRFLPCAIHAIDNGFLKIKPSLDEASLNLGKTSFQTFKKIHIPLLSGSIVTAGLLVFVEVMKELPATLIIRPFNFDTLAVETYRLASDERLAEASLPALTIILTGLIPVIFLNKRISMSNFHAATKV